MKNASSVIQKKSSFVERITVGQTVLHADVNSPNFQDLHSNSPVIRPHLTPRFHLWLLEAVSTRWWPHHGTLQAKPVRVASNTFTDKLSMSI